MHLEYRICVAVLIHATAAFSRAAELPPRDDVLVETAFRAAADRLVSGKIAGHYVFSERIADGEWVVQDEADIVAWFDRPRFYVDLKYQRNARRRTRRVIVYDATALTTSEFSPAISKTGCQAQVFPAPRNREMPVVPGGRAGFPWDLSRTASFVLNPPGTFESHPEYRDQLHRDADQNLVLRFGKEGENGYVVETLFAREFGFNPTRFTAQRNDRTEPTQVRAATWKFTDGIWHVDSMLSVFVPADLTQAPAARSELRITEFELNPEVSPDHFTLAALELPGRARILDQRPEVADDRRVLFNPLSDAELQTHLDRIVDQLDQLPSRSVRPPRVEPEPQHRHGRIWLVAFNLVMLAVIGLLLLRFNRRPGTRTKGSDMTIKH